MIEVSEYLGELLPPSLTGYEFLGNDGPICRDVFLNIEETYLDGIEGIEENSATLSAIYEEILETMSAENVQLVDNIEFIQWNFRDVDFRDGGMSDLPGSVITELISEAGAVPATDEESLARKLKATFDWRVSLGVQPIAVFDLPQYPRPDTCSEDTQEAYNELLDELLDGIVNDLDIFNVLPYLEDVVGWLNGEEDDHGHSHGPDGDHTHDAVLDVIRDFDVDTFDIVDAPQEASEDDPLG